MWHSMILMDLAWVTHGGLLVFITISGGYYVASLLDMNFTGLCMGDFMFLSLFSVGFVRDFHFIVETRWVILTD